MTVFFRYNDSASESSYEPSEVDQSDDSEDSYVISLIRFKAHVAIEICRVELYRKRRGCKFNQPTCVINEPHRGDLAYQARSIAVSVMIKPALLNFCNVSRVRPMPSDIID